MVKNLNTIDRGTKVRLGRWHNDDQADNTIVINASDTPVQADRAGLYMNPVRKDETTVVTLMGFVSGTNEIVDSNINARGVQGREIDYYANIGNTFTNTIKFEGDTSLTTEGVIGIANTEPVHTLDVGTKFYVDENGANVLTVLGDTYVQDDVTIGGNLDVKGTITSINTENTVIKDAIIEVGKGNTSSDMGIIMDRTGTNVAMGYRDTVDEFVIAHTTSSATSSTITPSTELIDARVHGRLHVNSNLTVDGDTLYVDAIRDRVGINTTNPHTDLDVVGSAHVHGDLNVDTDTLFVEASTDRVGINTLTPSTDFHVQGETYVSGNVTVDTDTFHVDTVNDRVGVNTLTPTTDFHVQGDAYVSGNVDVQTNLNVLTDAVVTGNVDVQTDLNVIGNVYATSNIVTTGNVDVQTNLNVAGNADVQTDLNVVGNAYISSNAVVTGNVDVQSELNVLGNAEIQTDLTVTGNAYVSSNIVVQSELNVVGDAYMYSNAIVTGNADVQTDLNVVGNAYVSSNAVVAGNVDVQTNLNVATDAIVTGNVDVQTDLNVVGNVYATSNIVTTGNVDVQRNLNVATDAIVTGNVDVQTDLNVTGNVYALSNIVTTGNVDVQRNLNVATDAIVSGNVYALSNIVTTGNVDVQRNLNVATDAIVSGNVDVQTDLNVVGNVYATSNIVATGNVDVQTNLNVSSNAIVTGNVDVQTNLNVATDAIVTGNVDVQTDLNVVGNAYMTSNVVVTGNVDVQTNLNVATDAIVNGNVDVQTDLNIIGNVYASSNIVTTGNVDVQQNLNVATDAIVAGNVDVQTNLNVSSNAIVTGNVDVQTNLNVATDAIVTGNVDVQSELNVAGNAYVASNAVVTGNVDVQTNLNVTGDAYASTYYGDGGLLSNVNLQVVSDHGNATSTTVQFTNATTGLVTTSNIEVGDRISIGNLTVNKIPVVGTGNFLENSTIGRSNGTIVISSDLEVLGDIVVDGNSYTVESNNLVISDRIIGIANNNVSHELDVGIIMEHPGKNIALIHHGEAQGDSDPHDHTFTIGYTQNTVTDNHVFDDSNLITVEILGNLITQNNLTVSENITVVGTTLLQDSVGIANTAPIHDLDVGSNLYVDDAGSNVLHVTGNVYATRFVGDGAFLENIASNLHEITTNGNVTTNTVQFDGSTSLVTTGKVGVSNTAPIHDLDVGSNLYMDDQGSNVLHVTGNVYATRFIGDNAVIENIIASTSVGIANTAPVHDLDVGSNLYVDDQGSNVLHVTGNVYATRFVGDGAFLENIASNLHEITTNGNVTTNTVLLQGSTALVSTGNVGIANTAPVHDLDVGSNLYVDDQGSNVLHVTGNIYATRFVGDGAFLENIASNLHEIITNGNVTTNTVLLQGSTALVATGNVGIANTAPVHDLDVGSNLYVDDQGSNVLHVTGNVYATRFIGDGAFLENIASNLHEVTNNGNVTTNTLQFDGSTALVTTGNVGIANTTPVHDLDVGSNLYVDDQGSNVLHVTGNVYATRFIGDGAFLENIASNLHEVTNNGNVTTNTIQFTNTNTSLVTTGSVGISNTSPVNTLDVGSNLSVEDTGSNVLTVRGNVHASKMTLGTITVTPSYGLQHVTNKSNVTTDTVEFINQTTSFVATSNASIGGTLTLGNVVIVNSYGLDHITEVNNVTGNTIISTNATSGFEAEANITVGRDAFVTGNVVVENNILVSSGLVTNTDYFKKKTYSFSNAMPAGTALTTNVVFTSEIFYAKITAMLVDKDEHVSTMLLDVNGGTRSSSFVTGTSNVITVGSQTIFGTTDNTVPWSSTVDTYPTVVSMVPSGSMTVDGLFHIFVEYMTSTSDGKLRRIEHDGTTIKTFDY
jgi:predicted acyltransferase (DUF342 family)